MVNPTYNLNLGDCRQLLPTQADKSVHFVCTDPPYFLDGLDGDWGKGKSGPRGTGAVKGLPVGMKFDPKQGVRLQQFMGPVAEQLLRVLLPGAACTVFSQPRLAHRMATAFEEAGFEIRDVFAWHYTTKAQCKAFSMDHFVRRFAVPPTEQDRIIAELGGRKTPQLRPQYESIILAVKPREGTYVENWLAYQTGLVDFSVSLYGKVPGTVMKVEKATEKHGHLTPKPLSLIEHLIGLFTTVGQMVLDPFMGSGTTCVAAMRTQRHSIGIEIDPGYYKAAQQRLEALV